MKPVLRTLTVRDVDQVHGIETSSFTTPWSYEGLKADIEGNPCAIYLGAFRGKIMLGYAGIWIIMDEAHMTNLAVSPENREQGVGRLLLRGAVKVASQCGARGISLEVRPSNRAALHLYDSEGFVCEGLRKHYYSDNGEDAYIMWLRGLPVCARGWK